MTSSHRETADLSMNEGVAIIRRPSMTEITYRNLHEELSRHILADGLDPVFDPKRSRGAYMYDARTQRLMLDLFSFFATQPLGFNHPKLATEEFKKKIAELAVHRPTLSDVYTLEYAQFVDTFGRLAGRGHFRYFFFVEGGTLGVENALKAAFDWKVRKNLAAGRGEKGGQIVHFRECFHGRSGYSVSMTNTFDPRKYQYFARFSWPRVTNPKLRFPLTQTVLEETAAEERKAVGEIKEAFRSHPHDIAAIILEPIQSEGGDNHFRGEFLRDLRRLADENDVLLIFDEVQTGMGLTGEMWCWEHFGVKPDLMAFGKKAQTAGFAAGPRIDEVADNVFHVPSRINSTWGGNLVDMVRCARILEIMEEDRLLQNVRDVGAYFLERLEEWAARTPRISNVRGRGLQIAFDLPDSAARNRMKKAVYDNGAILLGCGARSLRLRPHLDLRRADVDAAMQILIASERSLG